MPQFPLNQTGAEVQEAIDRGRDLHVLSTGTVPMRTDTGLSPSSITESETYPKEDVYAKLPIK